MRALPHSMSKRRTRFTSIPSRLVQIKPPRLVKTGILLETTMNPIARVLFNSLRLSKVRPSLSSYRLIKDGFLQ
jgi:hypothetical protein